MAVVDPPREVVEALAIPDHWNSSVFIFESDTETWDERPGGGVQLVCLKAYLEDVYKEYGPEFLFIWRSLVLPHALSDFWSHYSNFSSWLIEQRGKGYKRSKKELAGSALGVNLRQDQRNVFCSEIVAMAYFELNLLKKPSQGGKKANNYVPRDFSSSQRMDGKDMVLLGDCYLEKERRIKLANPPPQKLLTESTPNIGEPLHIQPTISVSDSAVRPPRF